MYLVVYMAQVATGLMRATTITRDIGMEGSETSDFFGPWNGTERSIRCALNILPVLKKTSFLPTAIVERYGQPIIEYATTSDVPQMWAPSTVYLYISGMMIGELTQSAVKSWSIIINHYQSMSLKWTLTLFRLATATVIYSNHLLDYARNPHRMFVRIWPVPCAIYLAKNIAKLPRQLPAVFESRSRAGPGCDSRSIILICGSHESLVLVPVKK